jgi:hypothetical protein
MPVTAFGSAARSSEKTVGTFTGPLIGVQPFQPHQLPLQRLRPRAGRGNKRRNLCTKAAYITHLTHPDLHTVYRRWHRRGQHRTKAAPDQNRKPWG